MEKYRKKTIVADSSPLIALASINQISLLDKFYGSIVIPKKVFDEITIKDKPYANDLRVWSKDKIIEVKNITAVSFLSEIVDQGEAEAIVLAEEIKVDVLLIDDNKGRKIAKLRGISTIGTLGILLKEKLSNKEFALKTVIDNLIENGFRISEELYKLVLKPGE